MNKFGSISDAEYYSKCLDLWLDGEQYGKDQIKYYIIAFIEIFNDSFQQDKEKTFYELTAFLKGDKSEYRTENITPYKEFLLSHKDCMDQIKELAKKTSSKLITIKMSNLIINDYSKGVEFVSKIYGVIIALFCITDGRNINIRNINRKTLYEKCKDIKNRPNKDYSILVDCVDRRIRNSQAHLCIEFNYNCS